MKKYLAFYENEWPANIAELTAVENKPFVGYLKGEGVLFTVIPKPVTGPADNEIWYTSSDGNVVTPYDTNVFGANIVSNTYEDGKGVITFDGDVTSIGGYAFQDRYYLTSITIPNSVTNIESSAFRNCSALKSIVVESGNTTYDSRDNCNAIIETATNTLIASCKNTIIPNSVTSIGDRAFCYCYSALTSIIIPNSVTSIGDYAFSGCNALTSIIIPNSVTSIGYRTFSGCTSITSITIGNSVTSIGMQAFQHCSSINSITFEGTTAQWYAITKGASWNFVVPATYVQCTDGQVTL